MNEFDGNDAGEQAVLAVLTGTPVGEAAARAGCSPEQLAQAVELYRAADRAALDARPALAGWHQVNIEFTHYPTADRAFAAYLLPSLHEATSSGLFRSWWFIRKYPCWRLRVAPCPGIAVGNVSKHVAAALDRAVSWGVVTRWWTSLYEPETAAFGGPDAMDLAHELFHTDSAGVLDYLIHAGTHSSGLPDAKATSFIVVSLFLRAAALEWSEQGDVWARVETKRPLPDDVAVERVTAMTGALRKHLTIDVGPVLAAGQPLAPIAEWITGMERGGVALADAARDGRLTLGTRSILARHVIFHWNRMGFTARQQAIWSRAARQAVLSD